MVLFPMYFCLQDASITGANCTADKDVCEAGQPLMTGDGQYHIHVPVNITEESKYGGQLWHPSPPTHIKD